MKLSLIALLACMTLPACIQPPASATPPIAASVKSPAPELNQFGVPVHACCETATGCCDTPDCCDLTADDGQGCRSLTCRSIGNQ